MNIPKPILDALTTAAAAGIVDVARAVVKGDRKAAEIAAAKAVAHQLNKASTVAAKKAKGR